MFYKEYKYIGRLNINTRKETETEMKILNAIVLGTIAKRSGSLVFDLFGIVNLFQYMVLDHEAILSSTLLECSLMGLEV